MGWFLSGDGSVISQLGPIAPYEGCHMGMISSGGGSIGGASSALEQTFKVPAGTTTLTIHYNFVSEEYWEWVGSIYNDVFNATLHTPEGSVEIAFESVNTATWYPVSGIDFPGGDSTCGQTGWLKASVDVSQYAGTDDTLTLTVHDVGDTIYDTVVLLDAVELTGPTLTEFQVALDTWGQHNPDYCSGIGAIDKFLCWSPVSGGGSCYAIATLELRWFDGWRTMPGILPRLRTVYDTSPAWVQDYAAGILQNVTALENAISSLVTDLENGLVGAPGVCSALKEEIAAGNPALVIQRGKDASNNAVGHAVVA